MNKLRRTLPKRLQTGFCLILPWPVFYNTKSLVFKMGGFCILKVRISCLSWKSEKLCCLPAEQHFTRTGAHHPLCVGHEIPRVTWSRLCLIHPFTAWSSGVLEAPERAHNRVIVNADLNSNLWLPFSELYCITEIRDQHQSFSYQCIPVSSTVLGTSEELNAYFFAHG